MDTAALKLRIALRLLALWRERPHGVREIERALHADLAGEGEIDIVATNREIERLEEIRRAGPFVQPLDRTLLPADALITHRAEG